MRVLGFCDYYSQASCGGAERVAREVYDRLALAGDEVTVVSAIPAALAGSSRPFWTTHDSGVRVLTVPATDLTRSVGVQLSVAARLSRYARQVMTDGRPHVLHAHGLHFHGSLVASGLARRTGLRLVTTAHLAGPGALAMPARLLAKVWEATISRRIVTASSGVVAVSDAVAAHMPLLGCRPGAVTVAPNGVDHARFSAASAARVSSGPLRVGFIGRLISNKCPQIMLQAAEQAVRSGTDLTLTFVGEGPMRPQLEAMASAGPMASRVTFTGQVADVATCLPEIDVVARPSLTEGLPLAVLEAMAASIPVIASDVPGNAEVIRHGETGLLVPVGDAGALSAALTRLALDRALLARLGASATAESARYTWQRSADLHREALVRAAAA